MPELSRFYGIIIKMMFGDIGKHNKPHIHVYYGDINAVIGLDCELIAGNLPEKQLRLVIAWITIHEEELQAAWSNAVNNKPFNKIAPLQ